MASSKESGARDAGRRGARRFQDGGRATTVPPVAADGIHRDRPANVDAERAVLGSILLKPDVCDDVALAVRAEDFHD